jgi:hypothetical protein
MTSQNFDKTLRAYQKQKPFRSYQIRFVSGEQIDVDHPEALVFRSGVAVSVDPTGAPTIFDHESVSEIIGHIKRRSARRTERAGCSRSHPAAINANRRRDVARGGNECAGSVAALAGGGFDRSAPARFRL